MNQSNVKHAIERYYDNLGLLLNNIAPGFNVETIHNFRLTYKNLRSFLRMLGKKEGVKIVSTISGNLHKIYHQSGRIRDLDLQQVRITNQKNARYSSLQEYVTELRDDAITQKQKLSRILSKEPIQKSKKRTASCLPNDFSIVDFQIYSQLKIALIISVIESAHIRDKDIHTIRKTLNDLYYNHKKYKEIEPSANISDIFEGKDDAYVLTLLEQLGEYHDRCISIKMIKKDTIRDLEITDREVINKIKKDWVKEKRIMNNTLIKKMKTEILSMNTYKKYDPEAANFA